MTSDVITEIQSAIINPRFYHIYYSNYDNAFAKFYLHIGFNIFYSSLVSVKRFLHKIIEMGIKIRHPSGFSN